MVEILMNYNAVLEMGSNVSCLTQQIKYVRRGRRERKKDLGTFYLVSVIYT